MEKRHTPHKILIIDDDSDCRKLLINWLANQFIGIEIIEYDPRTKGVPDKTFNWSDYDVLLLDYDLGVNGVTGLDVLKENFDNLLFPVTIMLTGAGSEEIAVRALQYGVIDYLRKENLKKSSIRATLENAFNQQSSKRQRLYTLDDALRVAKNESQRIVDAYKVQFQQERQLEIDRLKQEMKDAEAKLAKYQAKLQSLEEEEKNAEVEKGKLIIQQLGLDVDVSEQVDKTTLVKEMSTTMNELIKANESIKSVRENLEDTKAELEKNRWKQDQGVANELEVGRELDIVLGKLKKSSDEKAEMRERLDTFFKRDNKTVNTDDENQKLFDEITTQLNTQ